MEDSYLVNVVDVVEWIGSSFDKRDHIILKMDIEGAEHSILNAMLQTGLLQLIDVLSLECHEPSGGHHACEHLISAITCGGAAAAQRRKAAQWRRRALGYRARRAGSEGEGRDAIDPERFSLSRRGAAAPPATSQHETRATRAAIVVAAFDCRHRAHPLLRDTTGLTSPLVACSRDVWATTRAAPAQSTIR